MRTINLKTIFADATGVKDIGKHIFPKEIAAQLVESGHAEYADDLPPEKAIPKAPEKAVVKPPEKADAKPASTPAKPPEAPAASPEAAKAPAWGGK